MLQNTLVRERAQEETRPCAVDIGVYHITRPSLEILIIFDHKNSYSPSRPSKNNNRFSILAANSGGRSFHLPTF